MLSFSKNVLDELESLAAKLAAQIDSSRKKIAELEKECSANSEQLSTLRKLLDGNRPHVNGSETPADDILTHSQIETKIDSSSLSASIQTVLRTSSYPLKPTPIAQKLKLSGFPEGDGKTPLVTRVNNELFRLVKRGSIQRTEDGYKMPAWMVGKTAAEVGRELTRMTKVE